MFINPIRNISFLKIQNNKQTVKQELKPQKSNLPMPNYAHYLSFCGGSSLDLKESVKNLDSISAAAGEKFPPEIYRSALNEIANGNPNSKTLIDVHKEKYSFLNSCYDLNDVKNYFPEFQNVLSDSEVDFRNGSFAKQAKNGEFENFNQDEDLAFQLLKMYWAEGFSLTDLKKENDVDLYHTMKKFNIPLLDKDYAHVLKFSDKEYNERLTQKMAQSRMEARDRKELEKSGEPIYIPRGPLSEMHKKHISEGLLKHYSEHPEKLAMMSERQTEYFKSHPEQAEMMSKALTHAWKTQEGRTIQTKLIKFFKKEGAKLNAKELDAIILDPKQNRNAQILTKFWKVNGWAKGQFSIALTKGWQKAKEEAKNSGEIKPAALDYTTSDDNDICIPCMQALMPSRYLDTVEKWAKQTGGFTYDVDLEKIRNFEVDQKNYFAFLSTEGRFNAGLGKKAGTNFLEITAVDTILKMRRDMLKNPSAEMKENAQFYAEFNELIDKTANEKGCKLNSFKPLMVLDLICKGLVLANFHGYKNYLNVVHKYSNDAYIGHDEKIANHMFSKDPKTMMQNLFEN